MKKYLIFVNGVPVDVISANTAFEAKQLALMNDYNVSLEYIWVEEAY